MSWGVDLVIDHDDGYSTVIEVVDGHTYNLTPMWRKAVGIETTSDFDGQRASDLAPRLMLGLVDAWSKPAEYRELDPQNGWGDYDGFVKILARFTSLCLQHPKAVARWHG